MDVWINRTGQNKETSSVNCDINFAIRQVAYSRNAFALDKNILLRDGLP